MGVAIPQVVTEDSASGAQVIDGSLKFDGTKSQYLKKTFSSDGNRSNWTYSCWVKYSMLSSELRALVGSTSSSGSAYHMMGIEGNYYTFLYERDTGGNEAYKYSSAVLRDPSAWYHLLYSIDVPNDAINLYVNGNIIDSFSSSTFSGSFSASIWNSNLVEHQIGGYLQASRYSSYQLAQVTFIDGLTLGPGYFGFTDPLTNTWRPKAFKAEGTTVNNGTVWSSGTTNGSPYSGSYTWTTAFNGTPLNSYGATESGTSTNPYNIALPDIPFSTLTLYTQYGGANGIWVNGIFVDCSGNVSLGSGADSQTVGSITFTAEQLGFSVLSQIGVNGQNRWFGLAVDGVLVLVSVWVCVFDFVCVGVLVCVGVCVGVLVCEADLVVVISGVEVLVLV